MRFMAKKCGMKKSMSTQDAAKIILPRPIVLIGMMGAGKSSVGLEPLLLLREMAGANHVFLEDQHRAGHAAMPPQIKV